MSYIETSTEVVKAKPTYQSNARSWAFYTLSHRHCNMSATWKSVEIVSFASASVAMSFSAYDFRPRGGTARRPAIHNVV